MSDESDKIDLTPRADIAIEKVDAARSKADELRNGLSQDYINHLRHRAKTDLFWLATGVLGYSDLSPNLHGGLSLWMQRRNLDRFRLILLPRSHFKSTICTISDSIQIALPDDKGSAPYPRNLGVDGRILIAHEANESAQMFLTEISSHILTNPLLQMLFPEIVPQYKKHRINTSELELPRNSHHKEATFSTMGVGSKSQGKHFNTIKLDDIYGKDARDSAADRKTVFKWFNNIQAFLTTPKTDKIDLVGTRWAFDDIYRHAMDVYKHKMFRYIRPIWERDRDGNLQFIFPERFDMDAVEELMQDPEVWNAQYLNNPEEVSASSFAVVS